MGSSYGPRLERTDRGPQTSLSLVMLVPVAGGLHLGVRAGVGFSCLDGSADGREGRDVNYSAEPLGQ